MRLEQLNHETPSNSCLGTHVRETPFRFWSRTRNRVLQTGLPKQEFGNEVLSGSIILILDSTAAFPASHLRRTPPARNSDRGAPG